MPHSNELDALAQSLGLPADSLSSLSRLSPSQLADLTAAVENAAAERRTQLNHSLNRILFWPVRGPLLALLRRA